ncbi:MAG: hypothetical protein KC800_15755 [Candidatus Eremiobacteraeota bacterium]|nr:hypothetical protein [Candidatus Eremiobacteraeota bacterium]
MGLIDGALKAVKGVARVATAPVRTLGKIAGTGLSTAGGVLTNVAEGDLKGAAGTAVNGVKSQVGNVTGYFGENVKGVKEVVGGHVDFLKGGVGLIGTPVQGAARLAGNSLSTTGNVVSELATGDLNGAAQAYGNGASGALNIVGDTAQGQLRNIVG